MSKSDHGADRPNILLLMSGSIACAKASSLISEWNKRGSKVRVACTRSVAEFVGRSTLEGLGAELVFDNVFAPGYAMHHISLGKWADIVIAAPATANLINKLAAGIADDAVSTLWQAAYGQDKPMIVVPAMNTRMWRYPATRDSVSRLRQWGIHVFPVASGELACGERGEGRMLEPQNILDMVDRLLTFDKRTPGKRILVTGGGTREPIDSVRFIGNMSSGRTAATLTDQLAMEGHEVTWLGAKDALQPALAKKKLSYSSFSDLESTLRDLLSAQDYDVVIHAAAVGDFSVAAIETGTGVKGSDRQGKLSSGSGLTLKLKPNPKLLNQLKNWSRNSDITVIGFKLTDTTDPQKRIVAIKKQFDEAGVDAVVHNDIADIKNTGHRFRLHTPAAEAVECPDNQMLARTINELVETT